MISIGSSACMYVCTHPPTDSTNQVTDMIASVRVSIRRLLALFIPESILKETMIGITYASKAIGVFYYLKIVMFVEYILSEIKS